MEYKAIRKIKAGDMITFPYTGDLWETPTNVRREQLEETKSFFCKCERCVGPDLLRLIKCRSCDGNSLCTYDSLGTPSWLCNNCGAAALRSECEKLEQECEGWIKRTDMMLMMSGCDAVSKSDVKSGM